MIIKTRHKIISLILTFTMIISLIQLPASAEKFLNYLPENQLEESILSNDVFYLATSAATIEENGDNINMLKIGRGGDASSTSTALVKFGDITAKYGVDYTAYIYGTETEANNPADNESVLEIMDTEDYTITPLKSAEEYQQELENDPELQAKNDAAVQKAVSYIEEASGLVNESNETVNINPLQEAKKRFTGVDGEPQKVTASKDTLQDIQKAANVITNTIKGATLEIEFKEGEKEKYIAIEAIDNSEGTGDKLFYAMLGAPKGTTTNSAASNFACTIKDDEYWEPSEVFFSNNTYEASEDCIKVDIERKGTINTTAIAHLETTAGSAVSGRDFSPVDMDVIFPFGLTKRTIEIPIRTEYLEKDAEFSLKLTSSIDCSVSKDTAVAKIAVKKDKEEVKLNALEQSSRLEDIVLGDPINVSSPASHGQGSHFDGANGWDGSWRMKWADDVSGWERFWTGTYYTGTVGAKWYLGKEYWGYQYAGARVNWYTSSDCADVGVAFSNMANENWDTSGDYVYHAKRALTSWETRDFFDINSDTCGIAIYNHGNCEGCTDLRISSITPIYRPFTIMLKEAQPLKFLEADGSYSEWKDGCYAAISGAVNQSNNQLIRYAKEGLNNITLVQTLGSNNTIPSTYIKKIRISGTSGNYGVLYNNSNPNAASNTFTLNSDLLSNYNRYVLYSNNDVSTAWQNQKGSWGLRGKIDIEPEFEKKPVTVVVKTAENNMGHLKISGSDINITHDTTFTNTYFRGDKLYLSGVIGENYKNLYKPVGFEVSYKENESDTQWIRKGQKVYFTRDNSTAEFLDDNKRLRYGYYEVKPIFEPKGNNIIVRIKKSDIEHFDNDYGFISKAPYNEVEDNNEIYNEYIVEQEPDFGKIYPIGVSMKDKEYHPIWTIKGNSNKYVSEVFYHEASNEPNNNIVTISLEKETSSFSSDYNSFVTGYIVTPYYNIYTHETGYKSRPATGACISIGGTTTEADSEGKIKSSSFRAFSSKNESFKIRYIISMDGYDKLCETSLSYSTEENVNDLNGNSILSSLTQIGTQYINSDSSTIISKLQISSDNPGNLLIDSGNGSVEVKLKQTEIPHYEKRILDSHGFVVISPDCEEKVTKVKFLALNPNTFEKISEFDAKKVGDEFVCSIPIDTAILGSMLFVQVTTDKPMGAYGAESSQSDIEEGIEKEILNSTTYSEAYTGYDFVQKTTTPVPVKQTVSVPATMNFTSLPLIGDVGMAFNLPYFQIGYDKTTTGYRIYVGVSPTQIVDSVRNTDVSNMSADNGRFYTSLFRLSSPIDSFAQMTKIAYNDMKSMADSTTSAAEKAKAASSLGSPQWSVDVEIGVYFDFVCADVSLVGTAGAERVSYFSGVGGYVGVSGAFKVAWYTILPVVFLPAYFGVGIFANVMGFFGATTDMSKPKISYDSALNGTVDFDDRLGEFSASVNMYGCVQVYVGVGLAQTLGIRGGVQFDAIAHWEPSPIFSDFGARLRARVGIWVDLLLFSVPLLYTIAEKNFGSFTEISDTYVEDNNPSLQSIETTPTFSLRKPYSSQESEWTASENVDLMSGFSEKTTEIIEKNGYEHPDTQLLKLENGKTIMVFVDSDSSKPETERTTLKYSIMENGHWSLPKVIQNDNCADFQPSICLMDDNKVMVAWISRDPSKPEITDAKEYLKNEEVYTAVIDTNNDKVIEETRITNDNYFDYTPKCVYDKKTGDRMVYFVKADSDGSVEDMMNTYANDCVIAYVPYSKSEGKWLFDYYYDNEVYSEEDRQELLKNWNGQRFLSSPIPELGLDVPNIADFVTASYDGKAFYAYTIDQDSSNDTNFDKELFVQIYDFENHITYKPIRLTNDNVPDSNPQFIISGSGNKASTKLFWYRNENQVVYTDITDLVYSGIDADGNIKESYLSNENGEYVGLEKIYSIVSVPGENTNNHRFMADFKAVVDNGNTYVVWTQPDISFDENGKMITSKEIYATGLVKDKNATGDEICTSWSNPYRLTYSNSVCDEINAVTDENGNLVVLYNNYNQELTDDKDNPVKITDFALKATYLEPCGSVEATNIDLSNNYPTAGEKLKILVEVTNNGLSNATGYTIDVYEANGDTLGTKIASENITNSLLPGNKASHLYEWDVPQDFSGKNITVITQEKGMNNTFTAKSEELNKKPVYDIINMNSYQTSNGIYAEYTVKNNGNAPSGVTDKLRFTFSGPYSLADSFENEELVWGTQELGGIEPGESKTFKTKLEVIPKAFSKYGYVDCSVEIKDDNDKSLYYGEPLRICPLTPIVAYLNNDEYPEEITIKVGKKLDLNVTCAPLSMSNGLVTLFSSDDNDIASFVNSTLEANKVGTTTIHAYDLSHGTSFKDIKVNVVSSGAANRGTTNYVKPTSSTINVPEKNTLLIRNPFIDVNEKDWFFDVVQKAYENGIVSGVTPINFKPYDNMIRGDFVLLLYRLIGEPKVSTEEKVFSDVSSNSYYENAIYWAKEKGITNGTDDKHFSPERNITREEAVTMLYRFKEAYNIESENKGETIEFKDINEVSEYAKKPLAWASENGIIIGNENNEFMPKKNITRAECTALAVRIKDIIK